MKRLIAVLSLVAVIAACGGDSTGPSAPPPPPPPPTGALYFRVDALTCSGSGTIEFFIDGTSRFTQTLSAGQTSQGTTVVAGPHTAGARETIQAGYTWPTQQVSVPANGSYTAILTC